MPTFQTNTFNSAPMSFFSSFKNTIVSWFQSTRAEKLPPRLAEAHRDAAKAISPRPSPAAGVAAGEDDVCVLARVPFLPEPQGRDEPDALDFSAGQEDDPVSRGHRNTTGEANFRRKSGRSKHPRINFSPSEASSRAAPAAQPSPRDDESTDSETEEDLAASMARRDASCLALVRSPQVAASGFKRKARRAGGPRHARGASAAQLADPLYLARPCGCTQCTLRFKKPSALDRHSVVHSGLQPYTCKDCGQGFSREHDMVCHTRTYQGECASS